VRSIIESIHRNGVTERNRSDTKQNFADVISLRHQTNERDRHSDQECGAGSGISINMIADAYNSAVIV
jgi:hypothetical protein